MGLRKPKQEKLNKKLIEACDKSQVEEITHLLGQGADINCEDEDGWRPLSSAIMIKNPKLEVVRLLVSKGADLEAPNPTGWTNLMRSLHEGHKGIPKFLIESGANINAASTKPRAMNYHKIVQGTTPLMLAIEKSPTLAPLLIDKGADLAAKDADGDMAIHYAVMEAEYEILEKLIEKGVDLAAKGEYGWTPLHLAAKEGHFNFVELLVKSGADINIRDNKGRTPQALAKAHNEHSVSNYLQDLAEPAKPKAKKAELPKSGWTRTGEKEISRVSDKKNIGYKLTEIFNFESRVYLCLAKSLDSGVETQTLRFFDECADKGMISAAREELEKLGVTVDEAVVNGPVIAKAQIPKAG